MDKRAWPFIVASLVLSLCGCGDPGAVKYQIKGYTDLVSRAKATEGTKVVQCRIKEVKHREFYGSDGIYRVLVPFRGEDSVFEPPCPVKVGDVLEIIDDGGRSPTIVRVYGNK